MSGFTAPRSNNCDFDRIWCSVWDDFVDESAGFPFVWSRDSCAALKSFGYLCDRLFLLACLLYAVNRWGLKPHVHNFFLHGYFNDVLLIPCALPPLLFIQRLLGLRGHDGLPTAGEIGLNLIVWSILFEVIGPHLTRRATGDPWDVVAYIAGGIFAGLWWHRQGLLRHLLPNEL